MAKAKVYPLVMVEWHDATSTSTWKDEAEVNKIAPDLCVSVGWLFKKTSKFITIAASHSAEGDVCWSSVTTIPTAFAPKITELKDPRK